jgi:hypothetical protein
MNALKERDQTNCLVAATSSSDILLEIFETPNLHDPLPPLAYHHEEQKTQKYMSEARHVTFVAVSLF